MEEVKYVDFYVFFYYYDFVVGVGFIDVEKGGSLVVGDFEIVVKYVCWILEIQLQSSFFLCMDFIYVSLLFQEFGFFRSKVLKFIWKIDNVEISWVLGVIFYYIDFLNRQKSLVLQWLSYFCFCQQCLCVCINFFVLDVILF